MIAIFVVVIAIVAVIAFGWGKGGTAGTSTITPGSSPAAAAKPSDIVPKTLTGFDVANQNLDYKSSFPNEVSAAVVSFKPATGSKYANKVEHLTVYVHLFKDSKSAASLATAIAAGTTTQERDVSGVKYKLYFKSQTGEFILVNQKGSYVGYAFVKPGAGASFQDTSLIQDAVILGFNTIKLP
jgi:hypothetical protein